MTTVDYKEHGLSTGQRYYHGKYTGWEDDCVIAWQYLPKPYTESEKINCKATKCENCKNHNYCDYEPQESEE